MSELHEYRLAYVDRNTKATAAACVLAYSAEDALTQWRIANPVDTGAGPVFKIEPLPDAPTLPGRLPKDGELVAVPGSTACAPGDLVEAVRALGNRDANRLAALDEIADLVWPGIGRPFAYALPTLVEAVRKMRAERDALGRASLESDAESMRLTAERDALQKRIDAALQYRSTWTAPTAVDAIKAMVAILEGREP